MQLRDYQSQAVETIFSYFAKNRGADETGQPKRANPLLALPTGAGKALIVAEICKRALTAYPGTKILMSTHVKELIRQNYNTMLRIWPNAPIGIHSAGLKQRAIHEPIIFGGVKSMIKHDMGHRDLMLIDEAHLVSPKDETSYQDLIGQLQKTNPWLKIIGLTATTYRLGLGCLTNGNIFTDVAFNMCNMEGFAHLIAQGFLSPLVSKKTKTSLDVSNVSLSNTGDFNNHELQEAVDNDIVNYLALKELCLYGQNRRSWIVFASGIEHAEHLCKTLNEQFNIPTTVVHSKMPTSERDSRIEAFKRGEFRCVVNKDILTTGFDHPPIDLVGMLRPTMSTGLWVQMCGRAMRVAPGKVDALVLDFAGNTKRLGPINDPVIPQQKGKGPPGEAPVKECDHCGVYNHLSARFCVACGFEFTFQQKLKKTAANEEIMRSDLPQIDTFPVTHVTYAKHVKGDIRRANSDKRQDELPFSIKVSYYCGNEVFHEWVSVENEKEFVRHKGREWFRQRCHGIPPETNEQLLAQCSYARQPSAVRVWTNKPKYPQIVGIEWK